MLPHPPFWGDAGGFLFSGTNEGAITANLLVAAHRQASPEKNLGVFTLITLVEINKLSPAAARLLLAYDRGLIALELDKVVAAFDVSTKTARRAIQEVQQLVGDRTTVSPVTPPSPTPVEKGHPVVSRALSLGLNQAQISVLLDRLAPEALDALLSEAEAECRTQPTWNVPGRVRVLVAHPRWKSKMI